MLVPWGSLAAPAIASWIASHQYLERLTIVVSPYRTHSLQKEDKMRDDSCSVSLEITAGGNWEEQLLEILFCIQFNIFP